MIRSLLTLFILLYVLPSSATYVEHNINPKDLEQSYNYHPNQIIIKFKDDEKRTSSYQKTKNIENNNQIDSLTQKFNFKRLDPLVPSNTKNGTQQLHSLPKKLNLIYTATLENGIDIPNLVKQISRDTNVEYAEPNYKVKKLTIPNDPFYSSNGSWEQSYDDLWGLKQLQLADAWNTTKGDGVVVAVIDTGVDYNHIDNINQHLAEYRRNS
jgi:subtilisin family serine protease